MSLKKALFVDVVVPVPAEVRLCHETTFVMSRSKRPLGRKPLEAQSWRVNVCFTSRLILVVNKKKKEWTVISESIEALIDGGAVGNRAGTK